jgi:hypothetical protein
VSSPIHNEPPQSPASQSSPTSHRGALFMSPFIWHAWGRAVPKEWLTCPMFAAQKRDRVFMVNEKLDTNTNVSIVATGESLFQYDLDVLMLVLHQGRKGDRISFCMRDFVRDLHEKPQHRKRRAKGNQSESTEVIAAADAPVPAGSVAAEESLKGVMPAGRRRSRERKLGRSTAWAENRSSPHCSHTASSGVFD